MAFSIKNPVTKISIATVEPSRVSLIGGSATVGGSAAVNYQEYPASEAIGGHRVVSIRNGQLQYATNADLLDATMTIGITNSATALASLCRAYDNEVLTDSSFSFVVGENVYLTTNGLFSQLAPTTGLFNLSVGTAIAVNQLWVKIGTPTFF